MVKRVIFFAFALLCAIIVLQKQAAFVPLNTCDSFTMESAEKAVPTRPTPTQCSCSIPLDEDYKAQAGQDIYLFHRLFFPQGGLCCRGVFVEFGARNGVDDSNTYVLEKKLGWNGVLFEVDSTEYQGLVKNRPNSDVILGPVCPSYQDSVTIMLSNISGWTGTKDTYGTIT